ncbi:MAG: DUF1343 domain-containing protein [Gemmatimonadaceae bacterium]|nr:DUF1343 domain-containing protein [Gemmatimonadaceae bacterium]
MSTHVQFGVDRLCGNPSLLAGARRVALVTNDAARLAADTTALSRVAMLDAGVPLVRLFGPEHGLSATAADGAAVPDDFDTRTGLPVVSLYGHHMRPTAESLRDVDAVLYDIPDVGARFYTYTWTLYHVLAACEDAGVPVVVLDRPNPLGGELSQAEGPMLDLATRSFVGEDVIPVRHQLTLGELARLWQRERFPAVALTVVRCAGWRRAMHWTDTGLTWVPTSPAMPTYDSARCYPGLCLFEATNLSVGRGTDGPFQWVGAPWLDSARVLQAIARLSPNTGCTAQHFTPTMAPYKGELCQSIQVNRATASRPGIVALGLLLMAAIASTHDGQFQWAAYPTAANPGGTGHFERLVGRRDIRAVFESTPDAIDAAVVARWTTVDGWGERVREVLCYAS